MTNEEQASTESGWEEISGILMFLDVPPPPPLPVVMGEWDTEYTPTDIFAQVRALAEARSGPEVYCRPTLIMDLAEIGVLRARTREVA